MPRLPPAASRLPKDHRQQHHHAQQKHHPRPVLALAKSAEQSQRVRDQRQRKNRSGRPADKQSDRTREQRANPSEIRLDGAVTLQLGVALRC